MDGVLCYEDLLYMLKIVITELINRHHNDLLEDYFDIKKI